MELAPEAAAKAVVYAAVLLAIGASATRWLVAPRALAGEDARRLEPALAALAGYSAAAMLAAQSVRAVTHTAAAFGWRDALAWDQLSVIAFQSRWGGGWRLQVGAAAFLLVATSVVHLHRSTGWVLSATGAVTCAASMPLLGHAASNPLGPVLHTAHVLGAGLWLGTLGCVLLIRREAAGELLRHFAPIALTGASIAAAAGAISAVQYLGSPANLWATAYGRALGVKLAIVAAVLCCGYLNWRRWSASPTEPTAEGSVRLPILEALLGVAIVLATSVLTELAQP